MDFTTGWTGKLKYSDAIYSIINNKNHEKSKKTIHVIARASQTFFTFGCAFSVLGMYSHLTPLLSGGSFFFHGTIIVLRALEAILCHDLAKVSRNVASIFKSTILADFAKNRFSNETLGTVSAWTVTTIEDYSSLPEDQTKNRYKPKDFTEAFTYDTIGLNLFDSTIEKVLNTNV